MLTIFETLSLAYALKAAGDQSSLAQRIATVRADAATLLGPAPAAGAAIGKLFEAGKEFDVKADGSRAEVAK